MITREQLVAILGTNAAGINAEDRVVAECAREIAAQDSGSDFASLIRIIDAQAAEIEHQRRTLEVVERWANHHARKPSVTPAEALSVIQHHSHIREITAGYVDGVVPDTFDPYAEIERLRAALDAVNEPHP